MNPNGPNVQMLDVVAQRLSDDLCGRLVFVGGAVAGCLSPTLRSPRSGRLQMPRMSSRPGWAQRRPGCSFYAAMPLLLKK